MFLSGTNSDWKTIFTVVFHNKQVKHDIHWTETSCCNLSLILFTLIFRIRFTLEHVHMLGAIHSAKSIKHPDTPHSHQHLLSKCRHQNTWTHTDRLLSARRRLVRDRTCGFPLCVSERRPRSCAVRAPAGWKPAGRLMTANHLNPNEIIGCEYFSPVRATNTGFYFILYRWLNLLMLSWHKEDVYSFMLRYFNGFKIF